MRSRRWATTLVAALMMLEARAGLAARSLALVVEPDSVHVLSGMAPAIRVFLENQGTTPALVEFPKWAIGNSTRRGISLLPAGSTQAHPDTMPPPWETPIDVENWIQPGDIVTLPPEARLDVSRAYVRELGHPGVYRLVCYYDNDPRRDALDRWPTQDPRRDSVLAATTRCFVRSNEIVVHVDPLSPDDMRRLASDPDSFARSRAYFLIGRWGSDADRWELLQAGLSDSSGRVRASALSAWPHVYRVAPADSLRVLERLSSLLEDIDESVRGIAAEKVGALGDRARPWRARLFAMARSDPSPWVRIQANKALRQLGDPLAIPRGPGYP